MKKVRFRVALFVLQKKQTAIKLTAVCFLYEVNILFLRYQIKIQ